MPDTGLIAVIKNNRVILKVFSGSNGQPALSLAQTIKKAWPLNVLQVYEIAKEMKFGTSQDLVVLANDKGVFNEMVHLETERVFPDVYFDTFNDKDFNPRLETGLSEHTAFVFL